MRVALAAALLMSVAASGSAQSRTHEQSTAEMPRPSIGLPLPHIGLPLPAMGLRPPTTERSERIEGPERSERIQRPERSERFERLERFERSGGILFVPTFGWPYPYFSEAAIPSAPSPAVTPQTSPIGRVHFDVAGAIDPQVYVDDYYVGMMSDFVGGEVPLDAGTHTIELREDTFESLRVDLRVPADGVITYRGAMRPIQVERLERLERLERPESPPPTTIYMIPGCYIGNVPPREASLPAGCDPARAMAFPSRR